MAEMAEMNEMNTPDVRAGALYLGRLARAHAAGELATDEFRRRRRAFIEARSGHASAARTDITVPRTARALSDDRRDRAPVQEVDPSADRPRTGWRWLWVMPLTVALLVMLVTCPEN